MQRWGLAAIQFSPCAHQKPVNATLTGTAKHLALGSGVFPHTHTHTHATVRHSLKKRLWRVFLLSLALRRAGMWRGEREELQSVSGLLFPAVRVNFCLATLVRHAHRRDRIASNSHSATAKHRRIIQDYTEALCATTPQVERQKRASPHYSHHKIKIYIYIKIIIIKKTPETKCAFFYFHFFFFLPRPFSPSAQVPNSTEAQ